MTSVSTGADPCGHRPGLRQRFARLSGSAVDMDLRPYGTALAAIAQLGGSLRTLSDTVLAERAHALRDRLRQSGEREPVRAEAFALAREASHRALGLHPYDVQVVAALAMDDGRVVEMQTGEGKTLAAVMPAALHAMAGRGAHVLTFNDYLARRDAEWMGPIYRRLGLTVDFISQGSSSPERREAYLADVTYVTAKEAGFDHLRDLLVLDRADLVHRPFHFALIDEADSLLVDEARVPLVIAGPADRASSSTGRLAALVASLTPEVHVDTDEYARNVGLTDAGIRHVERELGCGDLHDAHNLALLTELNCALHAQFLLRRDADYIVRDGRIGVVDEFTGRVVTDRQWPDGLQAGLEAKEGLARRPDGRILGAITLQDFLKGYARLCGMTGTAQGAAEELREMYGLDVAVIPTHRPMVRLDHADAVFTHREAKERALVAEVARVHASGRPILVGTLTVEESERIAEQLRATGVTCEVLNAKHDAAEARVVAAAGAPGAVTISTNMAGRGTDIRLGGADGGTDADQEYVVARGGLYVIGTNRHESRRVDLQLHGRAGRQGDPGESRFFVSLDDDLLVRYGIRDLIPAPWLPAPSAAPVGNPVVAREIARAQRIIEGQNFEIRKTLWRYSSVLEHQRRRLMERRQALLLGRELPDVWQREPERRAALVAAVGEDAVVAAERTVTLCHIDRAWCDHLASCADLREGIHLVGLGARDPLTEFIRESTVAFHTVDASIEQGVLEALQQMEVGDGGIDLGGLEINGPASTWTYIITDDPFRHQIGMRLTGPGRTSLAIGAAMVAGPLLIAWGLLDRYARRRRARRRGRSGG